MVKVNKALFPLSGDPITNGHLNIIERASEWVDELIVVILENDLKSSLLTLEKRVEIIKVCITNQGLSNVKVDSYDGLLSDYATEKGVFHIIRGLRNSDDLEYEIYLEYGHKKQNSKIEIIYFLAEPEYRTTSSSIARSIIKKGGQIKDFVPLPAKQAMEEKFVGQYKLTITGSIASGKSLVSEQLVKLFNQTGHEVHHIDFDKIVKDIYIGLAKGIFPALAEEIIDYFGNTILQKKAISQALLSREIFMPKSKSNQNLTSKIKLDFLSSLLLPYIRSSYRKKLFKKKGIILLNIPMAAENNILYESNNNVLLVECNESIQKKRLINTRGMSSKEAKDRIISSGTTAQKKELIEQILKRDKFGNLFTFTNEKEENIFDPKQLNKIKKQIFNVFKI